MSAAAKALDALEAARAEGTSGLWDVREGVSYSGGVRKVDEYYVYSPSACDDVAIASDVVDPKKCKPSKANADLIALAVNLSAPLAAVARAAMAISKRFPMTGAKYISAAFDTDIKRLQAALDALEAAAAEGSAS